MRVDMGAYIHTKQLKYNLDNMYTMIETGVLNKIIFKYKDLWLPLQHWKWSGNYQRRAELKAVYHVCPSQFLESTRGVEKPIGILGTMQEVPMKRYIIQPVQQIVEIKAIGLVDYKSRQFAR